MKAGIFVMLCDVVHVVMAVAVSGGSFSVIAARLFVI